MISFFLLLCLIASIISQRCSLAKLTVHFTGDVSDDLVRPGCGTRRTHYTGKL